MQIRFNGEEILLPRAEGLESSVFEAEGQEPRVGRISSLGVGMSLQQVLAQLGLLSGEQNNFVVAHNQTLVSSDYYATTLIKDGDQLDVLGVITGG